MLTAPPVGWQNLRMDRRHALNGIEFVWDERKAAQNRRKHVVTFEQAAEAFFDPFVRRVDASRKGESRDAIIGMDRRWNVLFVVHIEVEDETIRIISARKATPAERLHYED